LQNPNQINRDNLQNVRREASRTRKGSIWKAKLMSWKLIIKTKTLEIWTEA
jgi:hypothetical protein